MQGFSILTVLTLAKEVAPFFLDNVTCNGSEASLISCPYSTPSSSDTHSEDVGVKCLGQHCFTHNMLAYKIKLHVNTHIFGTLTTNCWLNALPVVCLKGCLSAILYRTGLHWCPCDVPWCLILL